MKATVHMGLHIDLWAEGWLQVAGRHISETSSCALRTTYKGVNAVLSVFGLCCDYHSSDPQAIWVAESDTSDSDTNGSFQFESDSEPDNEIYGDGYGMEFGGEQWQG